MAVGDQVILGFGNAFTVDSFGAEPPLIGTVVDEPATDAVVEWRNGKTSSAIPQALLQKVFESASDVDFNRATPLIGKWMQLNDWPLAGLLPGSAPKSPAASGVVVAAFGLGDYDDPAPNAGLVVLSVQEGRAFITIPQAQVQTLIESGVLTEQPGRRTVFKNDG